MRAISFAGLMLALTIIGGFVKVVDSVDKLLPGKFDFGKHEYDSKCAVCHGKAGKGDGPYAGLLNTKVADLTTLSQRNNGMFPFLWVQEVIDGRQSFRAHGPSEMPIWGLDYLAKARESYMDVPYDAEAYVRTRILALTEYLFRLQIR